MTDKQPNILWFCTDQQRFDTIGALGNPYVSTPTIDRLCAEGTAFTHAYCQAPICTPSRASFLSGMYPSSIHVNRNGNDRFPDDVTLVTKMLANAGYNCGNIGKLHLAGAYRRIEPRTDDGYGVFLYSHAPRDNWPVGHAYADWVRSKGEILGELVKDINGVPEELHQTTWCAEMAIDFIEANKDQPWLLSVNVYDPHPPFNPPKRYRDMFDPAAMPGPYYKPTDLEQQEILAPVDFQSKVRDPSALDITHPILAKGHGEAAFDSDSGGSRDAKTLQAAYYAMIKLIDDQLERVLDCLEATGQDRDTIVIFTSDHGEMLGDHGLIQKGCRFYEGLVRVPLIWRWKGHIEEGIVSDALVELLDKTPTILDYARLEVPGRMHGMSLRPILEGKSNPHHHRDFVRSEYYDALDMPEGSLATMYRDRRYKIVNYHQHQFGELYDLENDPWEFNNLWDAPELQSLKLELIKASFDASMKVIDKGSPRIGPM